MARYADDRGGELEVADDNPGQHILVMLGWTKVEEEVIPSPDDSTDGDGADDEAPGDSDSEDSEEEVEEVDYDSWSNSDLRAELTARGLVTSGKKAELIARLTTDDES